MIIRHIAHPFGFKVRQHRVVHGEHHYILNTCLAAASVSSINSAGRHEETCCANGDGDRKLHCKFNEYVHMHSIGGLLRQFFVLTTLDDDATLMCRINTTCGVGASTNWSTGFARIVLSWRFWTTWR